jgi:hypothetical protein
LKFENALKRATIPLNRFHQLILTEGTLFPILVTWPRSSILTGPARHKKTISRGRIPERLCRIIFFNAATSIPEELS